MTCPKCQSHAEPIASWTISGHKMTIPLLHLWGCVNQDCRHQWPRDFTSPIVTLPSPPSPDQMPTQEVAYDPRNSSLSLSPSILDGHGH